MEAESKKEESQVAQSLKNANKLLSKIPIQLAGESRILEYTMYSIIKLDEECGISLFDPTVLQSLFPNIAELVSKNATEQEIGREIFKSLRPRFLTQLLWAGLVSSDPDLTVEEVARKLDFGDIAATIQAFSGIQHAIEAAMPSQEEQKKSSPQKTLEESTQAAP